MATNTGNSDLFLVTTKRTVPASTSPSGTLSSNNTELYGAGTSFLSVIRPGDWIVDLTNNEKRAVVSVQSDTLAQIESAFTTPLSGTTFIAVAGSRLVEIAFLNAGGGIAQINGVNIPANAYGSWGKNSRSQTEGGRYIDPIIVDGSTSNVLMETLK